MAQVKKSKPAREIPRGLEPKKSFLSNSIARVVIFSVIGAITVYFMSQLIGDFQESESIKEIGTIFAGITGIVPITLYQLKEVQRKDSVDKHMPVFLLALLSSVQSGANLIKAIEQTANRNLGALTPELKNLRANISWGMPMDEAFEHFANRTGTRIARRVTVLLEMAMRIGGDVTTNLEMIQKHVTEMQNLEKNRKSQMAPYTYTIYISYAVFIAVAVLLVTSFFVEIEKVQVDLIEGGTSGDGLFGSLADMDVGLMESALFNMAIIEAIFGGLAAGKIGAGSYMAGIKHVVAMIVIAIIAFNVI
ncbi:MAG: type II secretion system F family protein [Nitrosopumilaceae archaeon]|nr:type II secretion system F family protein [Nitrosopumilaceae archaeon]NIP10602.1 type II secretion system F family protein [Nitrosopumilaceae archaeon]NIS94925.1 type II secretion system F family protein [Nitrosopumilaceae archaeon]